jgi:hypothetical protein
MEDTAKFFGKFSQASYEPLQNNQIIEDYTLDNELSTPEQRVYTNPTTKGIVIASRGTNLKNKKDTLNDLRSDLLLSVGLQRFDPRIKREKENLKRVEDKYCKEGCEINTVGHSLGGVVSNELGKSSNNVKGVYSFNKGSTLLTKNGSAKETAYLTKGDLLSNLSAFTNRGKTIITNTNRKNKHTVKNFL